MVTIMSVMMRMMMLIMIIVASKLILILIITSLTSINALRGDDSPMKIPVPSLLLNSEIFRLPCSR